MVEPCRSCEGCGIGDPVLSPSPVLSSDHRPQTSRAISAISSSARAEKRGFYCDERVLGVSASPVERLFRSTSIGERLWKRRAAWAVFLQFPIVSSRPYGVRLAAPISSLSIPSRYVRSAGWGVVPLLEDEDQRRKARVSTFVDDFDHTADISPREATPCTFDALIVDQEQRVLVPL
jgi:hypothetical protein